MGFPSGSVVKNPPAMQEPHETQVQSLDQEDPLEEGMATHSSVLAWRIPSTEEPGGLQSRRSQRDTAAGAGKSLQSCPTLCDPIDGSAPGSSIHGTFQARVLE